MSRKKNSGFDHENLLPKKLQFVLSPYLVAAVARVSHILLSNTFAEVQLLHRTR